MSNSGALIVNCDMESRSETSLHMKALYAI